MRVVADTNVLVSAFVFPGGAPEEVYRQAIQGRIRLVTSRALLAELGRVLADKFGWEPGPIEAVVSQVATIGEVVVPVENVSEVREDPADDRVLEASLAAGADAIVSGDRHLLRLKSWHGIPILTPSELVAQLSPDDNSI